MNENAHHAVKPDFAVGRVEMCICDGVAPDVMTRNSSPIARSYNTGIRCHQCAIRCVAGLTLRMRNLTK